MKKLAVFDMAGTTINDHDEVYRVLREAVEREGARFSDTEFEKWMGTEKRCAIRNLLKIGGVGNDQMRVDEVFEWFMAELRRSYTENPPVEIPGAGQTLAELRSRDIKIALTTGFAREIADLILGFVGWGLVESGSDTMLDAVVAGDEVAEGRPAPYLIQKAMEQTGITDPDLVASVGDTAVDVLSANNAGVLSIGVLTGHMGEEEFEAEGAGLVVPSVVDLCENPEFGDARK